MRGAWAGIGAAVGLAGALAGCDDAHRAAADTSRAANSMADAADRMAASLDRMTDASNRIDEATTQGERLVDRAAGVAMPAGSSLVTDRWLGRWRGVEGTNLVVARSPGAGAGHYRLTMRYTLDDKGVFDGVADGEAIRFTRPDGAHELVAARGDETGLKWLAGKRDCLMVMPGEGYCRD